MPRVLVVDDEPFIRTTVSMLLTLEGCEVHTAADGRAGLQAALDNPPDLILSDVNMPHMGGALALGQAAQSLEQTAKEQGAPGAVEQAAALLGQQWLLVRADPALRRMCGQPAAPP